MARICTANGCAKDTRKGANGLCGMHYARQRRGAPIGDADYLRDPNRTAEDRIYDRLTENPDTGCWEWTGALRNGYGAAGIDGQIVYVHRWVYEHLVTEIPDGLVIDHHCLNRTCANPAHLDVVTRAVNNARGGLYSGARRAS